MEALRNWTLVFGAAATAEWFSNRQRIMIMAFVGTRVVAMCAAGSSATCTPCRLTFTTT